MLASRARSVASLAAEHGHQNITIGVVFFTAEHGVVSAPPEHGYWYLEIYVASDLVTTGEDDWVGPALLVTEVPAHMTPGPRTPPWTLIFWHGFEEGEDSLVTTGEADCDWIWPALLVTEVPGLGCWGNDRDETTFVLKVTGDTLDHIIPQLQYWHDYHNYPG